MKNVSDKLAGDLVYRQVGNRSLEDLQREIGQPKPIRAKSLRQLTKWWVLGLYYNYPFCCVLSFCKGRGFRELVHELQSQDQYERYLNYNLKHIPCQKCLNSLLKKQ